MPLTRLWIPGVKFCSWKIWDRTWSLFSSLQMVQTKFLWDPPAKRRFTFSTKFTRNSQPMSTRYLKIMHVYVVKILLSFRLRFFTWWLRRGILAYFFNFERFFIVVFGRKRFFAERFNRFGILTEICFVEIIFFLYRCEFTQKFFWLGQRLIYLQ